MSKIFDALREAELASRSRARLAATQEKPARAPVVTRSTDPVNAPEPQKRANERLVRHGTSRYLTLCFLGVLIMLAAAVFLRHYVRSRAHNRQATEITSGAKVAEILFLNSTVEQSTSALLATFSRNLPGFVLQVAAMRHEDNAGALAETLQQRNSPALVLKRGAAPSYRLSSVTWLHPTFSVERRCFG